MNGVLISSDMLDTASSQVTALKSQMETLFEQIRQAIRAMNSFWDSPAARSAYAQFEEFSPVFPQYIQLVTNYCTYLSQTAQAYPVKGKGYKETPLTKGMFENGVVLLTFEGEDTIRFSETQKEKRYFETCLFQSDAFRILQNKRGLEFLCSPLYSGYQNLRPPIYH